MLNFKNFFQNLSEEESFESLNSMDADTRKKFLDKQVSPDTLRAKSAQGKQVIYSHVQNIIKHGDDEHIQKLHAFSAKNTKLVRMSPTHIYQRTFVKNDTPNYRGWLLRNSRNYRDLFAKYGTKEERDKIIADKKQGNHVVLMKHIVDNNPHPDHMDYIANHPNPKIRSLATKK